MTTISYEDPENLWPEYNDMYIATVIHMPQPPSNPFTVVAVKPVPEFVPAASSAPVTVEVPEHKPSVVRKPMRKPKAPSSIPNQPEFRLSYKAMEELQNRVVLSDVVPKPLPQSSVSQAAGRPTKTRSQGRNPKKPNYNVDEYHGYDFR
ncbi:hypothetical protein RCL1_001039 [Eukaryota sp. TZLM3-RCL]